MHAAGNDADLAISMDEPADRAVIAVAGILVLTNDGFSSFRNARTPRKISISRLLPRVSVSVKTVARRPQSGRHVSVAPDSAETRTPLVLLTPQQPLCQRSEQRNGSPGPTQHGYDKVGRPWTRFRASSSEN